MIKRLFLLTAIIATATTAFAQDDLYFMSKKKEAKTSQRANSSTEVVIDNSPVYHSGSNRNIDEYNRRGSFASRIDMVSDSTGNDIIDFIPGDGTYPDSISLEELQKLLEKDSLAQSTRKAAKESYDNAEEDYSISRRMSRFDDFYAWGPWRYRSWFYDPWYYGYYDPWYYNSWRWHYSWYDPWYNPWYYDPWHYDPWYWHGGYGPWYPGGGIVHVRGGNGTRNHGKFDPGMRGIATNGSHNVSRGVQERARQDNTTRSNTSRSGNFSGRRGTTATTSTSRTSTQTQTQSTRSTYDNTPSYTPSRSNTSSGFSGGGFGGGSSHSSGGSFGGGGSRGGGSFGGRR